MGRDKIDLSGAEFEVGEVVRIADGLHEHRDRLGVIHAVKAGKSTFGSHLMRIYYDVKLFSPSTTVTGLVKYQIKRSQASPLELLALQAEGAPHDLDLELDLE